MNKAVEEKNPYLPTIGIESHVQLKTRTKLFAAVGNDAREAAPNTLISHICVGMPGALPYLNEAALELAARAAYVLGSKPQKFSHFDRKHYFYPDLPKGYQITQYSNPIIQGGHVHTVVDGQKKCVGITRAHLEEDAGKTLHPDGADYSLVDLNRAGTPLLEIVSDPDMHSAIEAKAYARELYLLMKYSQVTEADLYHGNMRFDVNVSISPKPGTLGTRTEVKNLNSFRSVEAAVDYEINRQIDVIAKGGEVIQETRGWDEAKQKTTSQRGKEEAHDYRYFPEPDIPPIELDDTRLEKIRSQTPILPPEIRMSLAQLNIDTDAVEDILDVPEIVPRILDVLKNEDPLDARRVAFDLLSDQAFLKVELVDHITVAQMIRLGELSSSAAKQVLEKLKTTKDAKAVVTQLNLGQVSDEAEIEKIVAKVITENPKAAEDVKKGETRAIGFLVGQVMKASGGQANPSVAQQLIKQQLESDTH